MTSTFTTNLNIEEPGHNDYVNTWDVPVNANWTLIDNAFGGSLLLNSTGLTGTIALTNIQLQPRTVQISGAPTGNVTYTVPAGVGGTWTVRNNTTGGKVIRFGQAAGGASIIIPTGLQLQVWSDGGAGMQLANSGWDSTGVHFPDGTTQSTAVAYTGAIVPYAGSAAPAWGLLCFGQAVSRTTYANLFAITGTTYGAGNGSTTFNVPDLRGLVVAGKSNMGGTDRGNLTGGTVLGATLGSQSQTATSMDGPNSTSGVNNGSDFQAATSVHTHANTNTPVVQPTFILNYVIVT